MRSFNLAKPAALTLPSATNSALVRMSSGESSLCAILMPNSLFQLEHEVTSQSIPLQIAHDGRSWRDFIVVHTQGID